MEIRTGTDIIEIDRIKESIELTNGKFCEKVYTKNEIEYCESKGRQKYQHYAARFAGKEAVFKAISKEINKNEIVWKDIEILDDENGRPYVKIENFDIDEKNIDISLSHCKNYAIANVVMLKL